MGPEKPILFFDGECNLCNGVVDFLSRWDTKQKILVASLQGETARALLPEAYRRDLDTLVYWHQGEIQVKSKAVLKVIFHAGGLLLIFSPYWLFPKFLADLIYDQVVKNRYALFGRRSTCRVPTPEERERFLP